MMLSKLTRWFSAVAVLPFAACGDTETAASPSATPNRMPTVTEYRGSDGRVTNITVSEDFDRPPVRVVVKNAAGEVLSEDVLHEFDLEMTDEDRLTPEEEEEVRRILEANADNPLAKRFLADLDGASR